MTTRHSRFTSNFGTEQPTPGQIEQIHLIALTLALHEIESQFGCADEPLVQRWALNVADVVLEDVRCQFGNFVPTFSTFFAWVHPLVTQLVRTVIAQIVEIDKAVSPQDCKDEDGGGDKWMVAF